MTQPVLVVAGPTASGKSGLALALAERFGGVVINADSMQVYRELAVLTARPGPDALARVPHRLYGVLAAETACSAGRWRELALGEIAEARAAGRLAIVTGGSGLYLQALVAGMTPLPEVPREVREETGALYAKLGAEGFHAALAARDPLTARRLRPRDRQRVMRAWEMLETTGRSLAALQRDLGQGPPADLAFAAILLDPPRSELYAAIDRRLAAMIAAGAVAEVTALLALGLEPRLPVMKAVGVPELAAFLRGEVALAEAVRRAQQASRRLAKRQVTWFRHHRLAPQVLALTDAPDAQYSERFRERIFNFIRQTLLTEIK